MVESVGSRDAALAFLLGRINFEHEPSVPYHESHFRLERMLTLCRELGNPHLKVPIVHVAGSKGKGSTSSMIASGLKHAGYRVGLYTSPHISNIEERICLDGQQISPEVFMSLVNRTLPSIRKLDFLTEQDAKTDLRPTFFEIVTAMAFLAFQQGNAEIAVVEVGLGGRLDSTNICQPISTVITSISKDHTAQLGNTIGEIAREKGGIVKEGVPLVSGVTHPEAWEVIAAMARARSVPVQSIGRDFGFVSAIDPGSITGQSRLRLSYWDRFEPPVGNLGLRLLGRHQHGNAAIAIATLRDLRRRGWRMEDEAIRTGVEFATCRGRLEVLQETPPVIFDTAHNGASMQALSQALDDYWPRREIRNRIAILATTRGKDQDEIAHEMVKSFDTIIVTRYQDNPRGEPAEFLAETLERHGRKLTASVPPTIILEPKPAESLRRAWTLLKPHDLLCITGSFFLAGEILPHLDAALRTTS
jgi:dihydrofolate synthase / folylpolyglutamate synthase